LPTLCIFSTKKSEEKQNAESVAVFLEDLGNAKGNMFVSEDNSCFTVSISQMLALMEYVRANPDLFSMEWPEGERMKLFAAPKAASWNVGLHSVGGWFEIEGSVTIDEQVKMSVAKIISLIGNGKSNYIRLSDNEYLRLTDPKCPATFKPHYATTRQRASAGWHGSTVGGAGACLADGMGQGKTVQTIAMPLYNARKGASLVAAPTSVAGNWHNEIARLAPSLNVTLLNDSADRAQTVKEAKARGVILTTYGILSIEAGMMLLLSKMATRSDSSNCDE